MLKQKESFILYYDWYENTKELSLEDKGKLYNAMFEYNINGELPTLTGEVKMAFKFMRKVFDINKEKYDQTCLRRKENADKRWENKDSN